MPPTPDDPRSALAAADQRRTALADGLRLPAGLHPVIGAAVAVQIGAAAYGIAAQTVTGLVVALAGMAVFAGVAAISLYWFTRTNGVRVDGLTSQFVLAPGRSRRRPTWSHSPPRPGPPSTRDGGSSRQPPSPEAPVRAGHPPVVARVPERPGRAPGGAPPRVLAALAVVACLGLVALVALG